VPEDPGASAEAPEASPRPLRWRLLRDPPLPGALNMAIDHALAACLGEGEAVLRLYGWARPTVSLGRNEPTRGRYPERLAVDFVRRPTGGRAVVHWRELTYAVVAPLDAWGGLRAAYLAINAALALAVRALGVPVEVASGGTSTPGVAAGPCFRSPAAGELVAAGRKLVGSAQARVDGALLQHGSLLLDDDQGLLEELAGGGGDAAGQLADALTRQGARTAPPPSRPATLRELVGDVGIDAVTEQVAMSLRETFGGSWAEGAFRPPETEAAERLEAERYGRDSWTWRT
jgi:lipoyl(octanoyl) transferase